MMNIHNQRSHSHSTGSNGNAVPHHGQYQNTSRRGGGTGGGGGEAKRSRRWLSNGSHQKFKRRRRSFPIIIAMPKGIRLVFAFTFTLLGIIGCLYGGAKLLCRRGRGLPTTSSSLTVHDYEQSNKCILPTSRSFFSRGKRRREGRLSNTENAGENSDEMRHGMMERGKCKDERVNSDLKWWQFVKRQGRIKRRRRATTAASESDEDLHRRKHNSEHDSDSSTTLQLSCRVAGAIGDALELYVKPFQFLFPPLYLPGETLEQQDQEHDDSLQKRSFSDEMDHAGSGLLRRQYPQYFYRQQHHHRYPLVDTQHPLKHIVDNAVAYLLHKKKYAEQTLLGASPTVIGKEGRKKKTRKKQKGDEREERGVSGPTSILARKMLKDAITSDYALSGAQAKLVQDLAFRVRQNVTGTGTAAFEERVVNVAWGGDRSEWWAVPASNQDRNKKKKNKYGDGNDVLDGDGGRLMAAYLKIMGWPEDLIVHFPFKLCHKGCSAERALTHTLEWREKYKPWLMTPSAIAESQTGWLYHRGHSRPPPHLDGSDAGHSMLWYRPALRGKTNDPDSYFRVLLNTLDHAVADSLIRSDNVIGRYNAVLDCSNFSLSMVPNLHEVKRGITMMQDHFPDRLGVLLLANLGGAAQLFLNMVKPLIAEAVRNKIHALPNDPTKRMEVLKELVHEQYIPDWLGGPDDYRFDPNVYYNTEEKRGKVWTDQEGREYMITMPYHG